MTEEEKYDTVNSKLDLLINALGLNKTTRKGKSKKQQERDELEAARLQFRAETIKQQFKKNRI